MATVQLFRRSQLPPPQVGQVGPQPLPPLEDDGTLEFIADFADETWRGILGTKVANEKASYQTSVDLAIERANTDFAANPGMSIEDLTKRQNQMFAEIKTAGQSLQTAEGRKYASDYENNNAKVIKQKFQTATAEIATQRALIDLEANHNAIVNNGSINADEKIARLELLYGGEKTLSDEAKNARIDRGVDEIIALQERQIAANVKAAQEVAENSELGIARGIYDTAILEGKTAEQAELDSLDYIRNSKIIAEEDKQEAQGDLNTEISYRNKIQKRAQDATTLKANNEIQAEIDNPTQEITAFIDSQPLDDIQKAAWKKAVEDDAKAQLKDDIDSSPFNQGSPDVFGKWLNEAYTNPQNVDPNEMYTLSMSKTGITTAQKTQILNQKEESEKALNAGTSVMKRPEVIDAISTLTQIESDAITAIGTDDPEARRLKRIEFQQIKNQLNEFINKSFKTKPDDPDFNKKLEIEVNRLTEPIKTEIVEGFFANFFTNLTRTARETPLGTPLGAAISVAGSLFGRNRTASVVELTSEEEAELAELNKLAGE